MVDLKEPIEITKIEDKIDLTSDICLIRRDKEYIGVKEYDVKSLRIKAKKDKGNRIIVDNGKGDFTDLGYMERGKIYAPSTHTIISGTEQEVEDTIKELDLKEQVDI